MMSVLVSPSKPCEIEMRFYLLVVSAASLGQLIPVAIFIGHCLIARVYADMKILCSLGCVCGRLDGFDY